MPVRNRKRKSPDEATAEDISKILHHISQSNDSFERLDPTAASIAIEWDPLQNEYATIDIPANASLLEIFLTFVPHEFISAVWNHYGKDYWGYVDKGRTVFQNGGEVNISQLYMALAVYIGLMGDQDKPKEIHSKGRPFHDAVIAKVGLLKAVVNVDSFPGHTGVERLISRFHIPASFYKKLSDNFQSVLLDVGRFVAGEEQVYRDNPKDHKAKKVLKDPAGPGLRFSELLCLLGEGQPYILMTHLAEYCEATAEMSTFEDAMVEWGSIVKNYRERNANNGAVVVFDSYYINDDGRKWSNSNNIRFIGAVNGERFPKLMDVLQLETTPISSQGDSRLLFNSNTSEVFVHHWDRDDKIGKKYVLSNAFVKTHEAKPSMSNRTCPAYAEYKECFKDCDLFNRQVNSQDLPFKSGGRNKRGANGHIHKFFMVSIVQNTFALYRRLHEGSAEMGTYREMCNELAAQIAKYALSDAVV